jgi:hypothetical protein
LGSQGRSLAGQHGHLATARETLNKTLHNYHGIDKPEVQNSIIKIDHVLCFGPHFSNSFLFSSSPDPKIPLFFTSTLERCIKG